LEGLASGRAMEMRWGTRAESLAEDHPAWLLEAGYLAQGCATWICTLSPERIVLGGGVMREHLYPLVRERVAALLNGYLDAAPLRELDSYIVAPGLGERSGILGAVALAAEQI